MLSINYVRFTDQIRLNTAVVGDGDAAIHPTGPDPLIGQSRLARSIRKLQELLLYSQAQPNQQ